jgi:hypothetical protein
MNALHIIVWAVVTAVLLSLSTQRQVHRSTRQDRGEARGGSAAAARKLQDDQEAALRRAAKQ